LPPSPGTDVRGRELSTLNAPAETARQALGQGEAAAAAIPARVPLGDLAPDKWVAETIDRQ